MNQEKHNFQNIEQDINSSDNYYYYFPKNQTDILIDKNIEEIKLKKSEPQDNIIKSKRRRLQEMQNRLNIKSSKGNDYYLRKFLNEETKENNEKDIFKSTFIENSDNISLTEIKAIRTNKIFNRELEQEINSQNKNSLIESNAKIGQKLNTNISAKSQNVILNNKEKISNINYRDNHFINMTNKYYEKISVSPKVSRKHNLSFLEKKDINNINRINNFEENDDKIYQFNKEYDNLSINFNNNKKVDKKYKRIKSLNQKNENVNYHNYKRMNSASYNNQTVSNQSSSSDNNNQINFNLNNNNDINEISTNEKVPMDNIKKRNKNRNSIKAQTEIYEKKDNNTSIVNANIDNNSINIININKDNINFENNIIQIEEKNENNNNNDQDNIIKNNELEKIEEINNNQEKENIDDNIHSIEDNNLKEEEIVNKNNEYIENKKNENNKLDNIDNSENKEIIKNENNLDISENKEIIKNENNLNISENKEIIKNENNLVISENKKIINIENNLDSSENKEIIKNEKNEKTEDTSENKKDIKNEEITEIEKIDDLNDDIQYEKVNSIKKEEDYNAENENNNNQNESNTENKEIIKEENNICNIEENNLKKNIDIISGNSQPKSLNKSYSIQNIEEKKLEKPKNIKLKLAKSPNIHTRNNNNLTNISKQFVEIDKKSKISKTIEEEHDTKVSKIKIHNIENKKRKKNQLKVLYKKAKNIDSKLFNNKTYKNQNQVNKNNMNQKKIGQKNIKTQSSKNNFVYSSNNIKNIHKIINRKRGINLSTKSLDISKNLSNNNLQERNTDKKSSNFVNYKYKKNKEVNTQKRNKNKENQNKKEKKVEKENNDINKTYSDSDLGEVGGEIIDESENDSSELDEINEINKNYYDPKSIVNYSSVNLTNKKERKYQSLSVSKNNLANSMFNKSIIKDTTDKKIYKLSDLNLTKHLNIQSQILDYNKIQKIKDLNDKINIKKNDIEKINRLIENMLKDIKKYDNEIRIVDNWIQKEENEGEMLRQMINFVNTK